MSHAAIVVAATGELTETQQFPATEAGMNRAISWAARRTDDDLATLWSSKASPRVTPNWPLLPIEPATRSWRPPEWTRGPSAAAESRTHSTHTESPRRSCPFAPINFDTREALAASELPCALST